MWHRKGIQCGRQSAHGPCPLGLISVRLAGWVAYVLFSTQPLLVALLSEWHGLDLWMSLFDSEC